MAASKQASTYVNTLPQCSPASVGLAQAHPNKLTWHLLVLIKHLVSPFICNFLSV